jgi:hypothetical protein
LRAKHLENRSEAQTKLPLVMLEQFIFNFFWQLKIRSARLDTSMSRGTKLISAIAVGLAIWAAAWIVLIGSAGPDYGRQEIGRASNEVRTVFIQSVDCGATTTWAKHVLVSDAQDITKAHRVAVFSGAGSVSAAWESKSKIVISYQKTLEVFQKDEKYLDIEIAYMPVASAL